MESGGDTRGHGREIAVWVAAAVLVRLAFMLALDRVIDSADAIHYIDVARDFAAGNWTTWNTRIPPLYPALAALAHGLGADIETAGRVVSLAGGGLLAWPVYRFSRALFGAGAARVAMVYVTLHPWLVDFSSRIAPEAVAVTLWFAAAWALARAVRQGGAWTVLAPVAFFLLHLARPEGTVLLLAAPVPALVLSLRTPDARPRRLVPYIAVALALFAAHTVLTGAMTGSPANPRFHSAGNVVQYLFVDRLVDVVRNVGFTFSHNLPLMAGPYVLAFAGAGLFLRGERRRDVRLELFLLAFAAMQTALAMLSGYSEPRYIMAVVVAMAIWAARGIAVVSARAAVLPRWGWLRLVPLALLVLLLLQHMAATVAPEFIRPLPLEPREYRAAGVWMREHLEPGLIITRKPQVGFYAGMETLGVEGDADLATIRQRAREVGAEYLVVDERYTARLIPALAPLLDPVEAPPWLQLVRADLSPYPEGGRVVIYAFEER